MEGEDRYIWPIGIEGLPNELIKTINKSLSLSLFRFGNLKLNEVAKLNQERECLEPTKTKITGNKSSNKIPIFPNKTVINAQRCANCAEGLLIKLKIMKRIIILLRRPTWCLVSLGFPKTVGGERIGSGQRNQKIHWT